MAATTFSLYDQQGGRKYLTSEERKRFFEAIDKSLDKPEDRLKRTFVLALYHSGCRISEALQLTHDRVDYQGRGLIFETLKRRKQSFRLVPVDPGFLTKLDDVHQVKDYQGTPKGTERLWPFGRTTGWKTIARVFEGANITGAAASPKGLRHSYAIEHKLLKTPESNIAHWLGHVDTSMMSVYGRAVGEEEYQLASRLWER